MRQVLLIDGAHGIYVPMAFIEQAQGWDLPQEAVEIVKAGPDHPDYWEAWVEILDSASFQGEEEHTWTLYQDGDLFAVRDDWEGPDND